MKLYRHFGSSEYDPNLFREIKNEVRFSKPKGGLYGIPIEKEDDIIKYFRDTEWEIFLDKINFHFDFSLKEDSKILTLEKEDDFKNLPMTSEPREGVGAMKTTYFLDFEELLRSGYDAVEAIFKQEGIGDMYYHLYSWDFSSILVLNKDAIILK